MKLIYTRHGETEENAEKRFQGHLPGKLSKKGIEQAKKVGIRLKDESIDHIYSSDLARAADTAKAIHEHHPKTPITFTEELRERDWGELQGKSRIEMGWDNEDYLDATDNISSGESNEQLMKRTEKFLHTLFHKHVNDTVLLVAHGGIGRAVVASLTGKQKNFFREVEKLQNTSITIFEIDEEKNHNLKLLNDVSHLD